MCNRLRAIVSVADDQCGFVGGKSTIDAIQSLRILMEKHRDDQEDIHLPWESIRPRFSRSHLAGITCARSAGNICQSHQRHVRRCQNEDKMCCRYVWWVRGESWCKNILVEDVWALLFADDILLGSKVWQALQIAFDKWKDQLEGSGLKISKQKTEHMHCKFSNPVKAHQLWWPADDWMHKIQTYRLHC